MDHTIIFETEVECPPETEALLDRVISATLEAEGVALPCEISVLLTDDAGIHQINREMREVDRPTDVLSFPMFQLTPGAPPTLDDVEADPGTGLVPLGDMVLSLERAEAQGRSTATARSGRRPTWPSTRCSTCWAMTIWTRAP